MMAYYLPATLVFLIHASLLFAWFRAFRHNESRAKSICFWGFIIGQLYLLWEVFLVKQTGKPVPGSQEQMLLMGRLLLGGSLGGLFAVIGLFYLSFATHRQPKQTDGDRSNHETSHH